MNDPDHHAPFNFDLVRWFLLYKIPWSFTAVYALVKLVELLVKLQCCVFYTDLHAGPTS